MANLKMLLLVALTVGAAFSSGGCLVLKEDLKECQARLDEAKDHVESLQVQLAEAKAAHSLEITKLKDQLQVAETSAGEAKAEVATLTEQQSATMAELDQLRNRTQAMQDQLDNRDKQLTETRAESERLKQAVVRLESRIGELQRQLSAARQAPAQPSSELPAEAQGG